MKLGEAPKNLAKVVPVLAKAGLSRDELIRAAAEVAIKRIGPAASEQLGPLFDSKEFRDYQAGCLVAQILGPAAKQWVPKMMEQLKSDDPNRVMASLFGLQNMDKDVLPAMDQLIVLLDHNDFNIQCGVCRIIEKLGPDGAPRRIDWSNCWVMVLSRPAVGLRWPWVQLASPTNTMLLICWIKN